MPCPATGRDGRAHAQLGRSASPRRDEHRQQAYASLCRCGSLTHLTIDDRKSAEAEVDGVGHGLLRCRVEARAAGVKVSRKSGHPIRGYLVAHAAVARVLLEARKHICRAARADTREPCT